jgi:tellurite methyltransferase
VIRVIDGFHQDDEGDWVAELSCLHDQHVRHRPPFRDRSWVTSDGGRADRIGSPLDCPLCDRMELPAGLEAVRTAGPFDAATLPPALRRAHLVADRTWGLLRVLEGSIVFAVETTPPVIIRVHAGDEQPIPPGVRHRVEVDEPVRIAVDFLVKPKRHIPSAGH